MVDIPFQSEHFPGRTTPNTSADLTVNWGDILWAAVTVGRPTMFQVLRHGTASIYEALFRIAMVRMALEQRGPAATRLRRTSAFKTLDPTEKGAVNYFLGLTFCKMFAAKLLKTPWLLHLDVYRPALTTLLPGRSRPDLIGKQSGRGPWHSFESKGRASPPSNAVKTAAKAQATRIVSVGRSRCRLHVGAITYFKGDVLSFYWCDPPADATLAAELDFREEDWQHYYLPVSKLYDDSRARAGIADNETDLVPVEGADLRVGLHPSVAQYILQGRWREARDAAYEARRELAAAEFQSDGIKVVAGDSWLRPFADTDAPGG